MPAVRCGLRRPGEAQALSAHAPSSRKPAPGWSQRLSRAIGIFRAREVSLTGNWVSAEQAAAWGFVNRVVPADELPGAARALAQDMLGCVPEMLVRCKAIIGDGFALPFGEGMALEKARGAEFNATVGAAAVESRREAVRARNRGQHALNPSAAVRAGSPPSRRWARSCCSRPAAPVPTAGRGSRPRPGR